MTENSLFRLTRAFFSLAAAVALSIYAYIGVFTRPIGDDYCFSAWLNNVDPLTAGLYKYLHTSNRFSNQFVVYLSDLFGPRGVGLLAVSMLVLWLVGLTWLFAEIAWSLRIRWSVWTGLLLAELIALVSYYSAANLFQSVYWRPGLMTYFMPLVIYAFIFAGILRGTRRSAGKRASLWTITVLFFASFLTGGLSETAGALHVSLLGLALVVTFVWNKGETRRAALGLITATLAGALLALVGMFLAPANAFRIDAANSPTLPEAILRALLFGLQFLGEAARLLRIPAVFMLGAGGLLGFLSVKAGEVESPAARKLWVGLIVVPVLMYLLTVASFAPSAYGQSYPAERVRFPAHVLLSMSLLLEGGLAGLLTAHYTRTLSRWTTALALAALFVAALYPLWVTRNTIGLVPAYQTRASEWDQRDASIREAAANGERNIVTWQLPGIANVKDLDTRPNHWVNFCAAYYYGVDTVSAPQGKIPIP